MKKFLLPLIALVLALCFAAIPATESTKAVSSALKVNSDTLLPTKLPPVPYDYHSDSIPFHLITGGIPFIFLLNSYDPRDNPITDEGATLGRVLFYDKKLSANYTISCASCHQSEFGFSDSARLSEGFLGGHTDRNSMGLMNAKFPTAGLFFWDCSADSMREQIKKALTSQVEMGMNLDTLVDRVQQSSYYPALFQSAFGSANVTADKIALAIGQFVRSMNSFNTKFDEAMKNGEDFNQHFTNYTVLENQGKDIFMGSGGCTGCHLPGVFIGFGPENNGLDLVYADKGYGDVTGIPADNGKFKSSSLRNIALTAPYMHDGRFSTLMEVVEHYNSGVQAHPNLSDLLEDGSGNPKQLNLTSIEKTALIAFLETLTDTAFLNDVRWSDPFDRNPNTGIFPKINTTPLTIFPNPMTEAARIKFENPNRKEVTVQAFDVSGKMVWEKMTREGEVILTRKNMVSGVYAIEVLGSGSMQTGKLVVN